MPGRACRGPATARRCSAASTAARRPRTDPAARVQLLPGQQVTGAPLVVQPVRQLGHHLPVPAVPAPEQPQRQHEIHHQPRREQPSPLLPGPGRVNRRIHQLRRENPGQHTDRDPVRQPAVRREPFRTVMRHETVTIPPETLRQGHWPPGPRAGRSGTPPCPTGRSRIQSGDRRPELARSRLKPALTPNMPDIHRRGEKRPARYSLQVSLAGECCMRGGRAERGTLRAFQVIGIGFACRLPRPADTARYTRGPRGARRPGHLFHGHAWRSCLHLPRP